MFPVTDRIGELLDAHPFLFGVICRDPTWMDIELISQAGYHIVWLDLEHSTKSMDDAFRMTRFITQLGMVPLVRIPELSKTNVQPLLDSGVQILALPDVRSADQATEFVRLAMFPPVGQRGVSTTAAGIGFNLGIDPGGTLRSTNDATHLMVIVESDEGYEALDSILEVNGIDIVTVGLMDWSASLGVFGDAAMAQLAPKVDRVLTKAREAGKLGVAVGDSPARAYHYLDLGVRIFFVGVDVAMKRRILCDTLRSFREVLKTGK